MSPAAEKQRQARTIIRLYDPTWGTVKFNGIEISGKMDRELHKYITDHIAMIFQDPIASLNPRMTVQEIIAEGLKIRGVKDPEELQKRVIAMLEHVGLQAEHASRYPLNFRRTAPAHWNCKGADRGTAAGDRR